MASRNRRNRQRECVALNFEPKSEPKMKAVRLNIGYYPFPCMTHAKVFNRGLSLHDLDVNVLLRLQKGN